MKAIGGMYWSGSAKGWLGYFATMADGRVLCRHEQTFTRVTPEDAAKQIKSFCASKGVELKYVIAQPGLFPSKDARGETVSETFTRNGVPMVKGDDDRINGFSRVRSWLQPIKQQDGHVAPSLLIHADCQYLLRTLPTLISSPTDPDDVDESPEEFPTNGVRFFVMSRPMPTHAEPPDLPEGAIGHELRTLRAKLAADAY